MAAVTNREAREWRTEMLLAKRVDLAERIRRCRANNPELRGCELATRFGVNISTVMRALRGQWQPMVAGQGSR